MIREACKKLCAFLTVLVGLAAPVAGIVQLARGDPDSALLASIIGLVASAHLRIDRLEERAE